MNASLNLHGVIVPLVTPFLASGALDERSFDALVEELLGCGVHGLVLNGTTGESSTVRWDEVERLARRLVARVDGRAPIVIGCGTSDTAESIAHAARARDLGADAALVVVPYYSRPAPAGVIAHFAAVARAGLPLVAYHIPYRTGLALDPATLSAILDLPGVIGIKESSGGLAHTAALVRRGDRAILCGDDALFLASLATGAQGGILASGNVCAAPLVAAYEAARAGRLNDARLAFSQVLPLIELLFAEPNPTALKWVLARRGLIATDQVRLPHVGISDALATRLADVTSTGAHEHRQADPR
jgi:4-hydroxy-tetrahydrodipicolinate synthase